MLDVDAREAYRTTLIVCVAMPVGVLLYGLVALYLVAAGLGDEPAIVASETVLAGVGVAVLATLLAAPVVGARLRESGPGAGREQVLKRFRTGHLVTFGLWDGAGILGITVGLLADDPLWIAGLGGAALVAMLLGLPRRQELEERLRRPSGD